MLGWIMHRLSVRKCRSVECQQRGGWHDAHLTWVGKLHYGLPWREVRVRSAR